MSLDRSPTTKSTIPAAAAFIAVWFIFALALTTSRALAEPEFGDEQLFLGGAGLMAREAGLLIYRDFCYNHAPTHALLLAGLFRLTDRWLLVARMLDATCAAMLATLVVEGTRRALAHVATPRVRVLLASLVGCLFLFNPLTGYVVGKAWNHDLAAMSCVLGYGLLVRGLLGDRPRPAAGWLIASGLFAGIAATSRLTFVPPLAGFAVLLWFAPGLRRWRDWARAGAFWWAGAVVGAGPAIYVVAQAPERAYFGNVEFPWFSALDRLKTSVPERLLLSTKFDYAWQTISASTSLVLLFVLTLAAVAIAFRPYRFTLRRAAFAGLVAMLAAAAFAAFKPTPMYQQYLYGPIPFATLAIGWALPQVYAGRFRRAAVPAFALLSAIVIATGASRYRSVTALWSDPSTWTPNRQHVDAKYLTALAGPRARILTFAPGTALEGGNKIYRKLAIGRYGLRVGEMLGRRRRQEEKLPTTAEIEGWFDSLPPDLVLLVEPKTPRERRIAQVAAQHGYWKMDFGPSKRVLLPPTRSPTTVPSRADLGMRPVQ